MRRRNPQTIENLEREQKVKVKQSRITNSEGKMKK
jgi:hypothetical protein